jgi:hypothetical protein
LYILASPADRAGTGFLGMEVGLIEKLVHMF